VRIGAYATVEDRNQGMLQIAGPLSTVSAVLGYCRYCPITIYNTSQFGAVSVSE
jgi:hypothetical protein